MIMNIRGNPHNNLQLMVVVWEEERSREVLHNLRKTILIIMRILLQKIRMIEMLHLMKTSWQEVQWGEEWQELK